MIKDFFIGRNVDFADLDLTLSTLRDRWLSSRHVLPSGEMGWYRRLNIPDRFGVLATANGIFSLRRIEETVPYAYEIIKSLLGRRRSDGSWSFVTNLNDQGVIDATAVVILSLCDWQNDEEFQALNLTAVIQESLQWLERSALEHGGWGIVRKAQFRAYSTALAIQALSINGRGSSPVVRRSLDYLISVADPATGAWHDSSRQLSIPTTCEVIRAITRAASDSSMYRAESTKACDWILNTARQTSHWMPGARTACNEEVEIEIGGRFSRVEYAHSPRPVVVTALCEAGLALRPEVVIAVRLLLDDVQAGNWEAIAGTRHSELKSWTLYDITIAVTSFRSALLVGTRSVWTNRYRTVEIFDGDGTFVRIARIHWRTLAIMLICGLFVWLLIYSGLAQGTFSAVFAFIVSTLSLNVLSNAISELWKERN